MAVNVSKFLQQYGVDPEYGFLLRDPLIKLPEKFQPWQEITDRLPDLLESNKIDAAIDALPIISTEELEGEKELRLAHLILSTLAAAHVWNKGSSQARFSVPKQISLPLLDISYRVGLKPIVAHACVCLANWKRVNDGVSWKAEDMDLIAFKFIKDEGNKWFFLLTAQIEVEFADAISAVTESCLAKKLLDDTLQRVTNSILKVTATLKRMKERLSPSVFYNGFRQYLAGYTHDQFKEQGGMIYEGKEDIGSQYLNGGSAAQSSTLHVIDAFLGIQHFGGEKKFLETQRDYMPPKHKLFIEWIEKNVPSMEEIKNAPNYSETVDSLRMFRCEHIRVVTSYIVNQASADDKGMIGTGGSLFMQLLKAIRDDLSVERSKKKGLRNSFTLTE